MTTKKHLKRRVRLRAAQTGEPYATALRNVRRQQEGTVHDTSTAEDLSVSCSFCGKPNTRVQRLVAGPGVYICNECVELASWVVEDAARATPEEASRRRAEYRHSSDEHLLERLASLVRSGQRVEDELAASISRLRERGTDWPTIADAAGMTVDAARRRFGPAGAE